MVNQNRWVVSVPGTSVTEYYRPTVLAQTTHHYSATALGRKTKRLVVLDQPEPVEGSAQETFAQLERRRQNLHHLLSRRDGNRVAAGAAVGEHQLGNLGQVFFWYL